MSWRGGGGGGEGQQPPANSPTNARKAKATNPGALFAHSGDGSPGKAARTAQQVAEDLEKQLDELHAAQARDLQQRKEAAAKELEASKLQEPPAKAADDAAGVVEHDTDDDDDDDFRLDPMDGSDYEDDEDDQPVLQQSTHISLVESQLGCSADAADLEAEYTVIEED